MIGPIFLVLAVLNIFRPKREGEEAASETKATDAAPQESSN